MSRFLDEREAATVEAMCGRIVPSEPGRPGAREARAANYIDCSLAEAYDDLQQLYRDGVRELNALCLRRNGVAFPELDEREQDAILSELDAPVQGTAHEQEPAAAEHAPPLQRFFAVVREHTVQGMFCDPQYGGNHDAIGWRLIGFPGTQWGYTAEQMRPGFDAALIPVRTLADLRRENALPNDVEVHR
jgi:gluconate 2-dehydrogenase gamma chain